MSTTRPAAGGAVTGYVLVCALLLLGGLVAVVAGPDLLARVYESRAMRPVPYYALAVTGLLVVGTLLVGGGHHPRGARRKPRVRCRGCGAVNEARARFCNQCGAAL